MKKYVSFLAVVFILFIAQAAHSQTTYAEKLGFPAGARVLILHVDDAGMSYESNQGTIDALTKGVANSTSVMMPCGWVPGFVHWLKANPNIDAGLHLTLTSEWKDYRWVPLSGKPQVPGLVDSEGAMWATVENVVKNASAEEIYTEIKAQLERAREMGFHPTHLDSHMGTLFATPEFVAQYIRLGIENKIPVMFPGGEGKLIQKQMHLDEAYMKQIRLAADKLWQSGLPVLDDLFNETYDWKIPVEIQNDEKKIDDFKTEKYISALKELQPGVTMMIMHCTIGSPLFQHISDSGPTRKGDLLAMMNPAFRQALADEGIVLTTWRELMERRSKLK